MPLPLRPEEIPTRNVFRFRVVQYQSACTVSTAVGPFWAALGFLNTRTFDTPDSAFSFHGVASIAEKGARSTTKLRSNQIRGSARTRSIRLALQKLRKNDGHHAACLAASLSICASLSSVGFWKLSGGSARPVTGGAVYGALVVIVNVLSTSVSSSRDLWDSHCLSAAH